MFHLLLQPDTLSDLLEKHPGGGVPTWLLEVDSEWIVSFASLSHYYYYGGMPPSSIINNENGKSEGLNGSNRSSKSPTSSSSSSSSSSRARQHRIAFHELKVETIVAIETIAVLLHYDVQKLPIPETNNENDENSVSVKHPTNDPLYGTPSRKRLLSHADRKYHAAKMHVMLADLLRKLQVNGTETPLFENEAEQFRRLEVLDVFWDVSFADYRKCKEFYLMKYATTQQYEGTPKSWTLCEFIEWANKAIPDDSTLDHVMHQLFGLGLLPSPAMERKLVCESWIDWQKEFQSFDTDTVDSFSASTKNTNLFTSSNSIVSGTAPRLISKDNNTVWGGIGGFDNNGGLGYGILYCVEKAWWDQWAKYVSWEWSDGSIDNLSREKPYSLSTDKLIEHDPSEVIQGSLGSYEQMKRGLKRNEDYVLVPPGVWDILYELYGGGPPLPRMINAIDSSKDLTNETSSNGTAFKIFDQKPIRIPRSLNVMLHPWVLDCRVCICVQKVCSLI